MNKMKKIGLTALATSLVASSAYAADVTIAGATGFTYSNQNGDTGTPDTDHGKGFGVDNSMTFSTSGEMDNGWSVSAYTATNDSFGLTSSAVTLTMGGLGSITSGSGYGGNSAAFDGETPRAYEEVDDGGASSLSMNLVGSQNDNGGINYKSPTIDSGMGTTATIYLGYVPKASDSYNAGGGTSGVETVGSGKDAGLLISSDTGLSFGIFGSTIDRLHNANGATTVSDAFEGTWFAKYSMGPVSVGYQESYHDSGVASNATAATSAKVVNTAAGIFEANTMSIAFNVNDNLSVSYAEAEDTYDAQSGQSAGGGTTGDNVADVTMDMKSIQAAYSMGSMSIKAYRTETDNASYSSAGDSVTVNEIALGLSF